MSPEPSTTPTPAPRRCPNCGGEIHLRSPHTAIASSKVIVYCSARCLADANDPSEVITLPPPVPARHSRLGAMLLLLGLVGALLAQKHDGSRAVVGLETTASITLASMALEPEAPPPSAADLVAEHDRVEREIAEREERMWQEKLSDDRWVHPLPGPKRRMPLRLSRVFGAERPGHRPNECQAGHCGVDIGGEVWGEPVLASHDGVAIKVNRDPSRSGGKYVRIGHRGETVFTQYFHLAAIPRSLKEGTTVRAGQVIGLLGETGIVESRPHLHYTVSVRESESDPEQYIDPEPLIALWPVAVPVFGDVGSIARTHLVPGHPRGPYNKARKSPRKRDRKSTAEREASAGGATSAADELTTEPTARATLEPPGL